MMMKMRMKMISRYNEDSALLGYYNLRAFKLSLTYRVW